MADEKVEYRTIAEFEGYEIGSDGTVWSHWKRISLGRGRGVKYVLAPERHKMNPSVKDNGYLVVRIGAGKARRYAYLSRLVLMAFVGPPPKPKMDACHDPDRAKTNCKISNLRWGTRKENLADKIKHGTQLRGQAHPASVMTDGDVFAIIKMTAQGKTIRYISKRIKRSWTTVYNVLKGKCWRHITGLPAWKPKAERGN